MAKAECETRVYRKGTPGDAGSILRGVFPLDCLSSFKENPFRWLNLLFDFHDFSSLKGLWVPCHREISPMKTRIKSVSSFRHRLFLAVSDLNCKFAAFTFADPIEHATGDEKIVLILEERGITVSSSYIFHLFRHPLIHLCQLIAGPLLHGTHCSRPRDER